MRRLPVSPTFQLIIQAALLALCWALFAPMQLGGQTGYAVINGNSMEPTMHAGDLALLRPIDEAAVGDVVLYHDPDIGPVIHRIIEQDADRYVLQGDNNTWLDPYRPTDNDMQGRLWFFIPKAGSVFDWIAEPYRMALLTGIIGIVLIMTTDMQQPNRKPASEQAAAASTHAAGDGMTRQDVLTLLGVIALTAAVLAFIAFRKPTTQPGTAETAYQHTGAYSYEAAAPSGLYDSSGVTTGDPVFFQTSSQIALTFDYALQTEATASVVGTAQLDAELADKNGWHRTLEVSPASAFNGRDFSITGVLTLPDVLALIENYEAQTGIQHATYTLTIQPQVAINGTVDGVAIDDDFGPPLVFNLNRTGFWLPTRQGGDPDPLHPSADGAVSHEVMQPTTLTIFGMKLNVVAVRWASLAALAVTAVSAAFLLRGGQPSGSAAAPPAALQPDRHSPARKRMFRLLAPNTKLSASAVALIMLGSAGAGLLSLGLMVFGVNQLASSTTHEPSVARRMAKAELSPAQRPAAEISTDMLDLPGGTFTIGSSLDSLSAPETVVTVAPYRLDRYEVTVGQWLACVQAGICDVPAVDDLPGGYYGEQYVDYPAVGVSWYEASTYCQWRSGRLPTAAEWEMAARWDAASGGTTVYPWGDVWEADRANVSTDQPVAVGAFPQGAAASGAQNMAGNAAEWVLDVDGAEPVHVVRGGAWNLDATYAASTASMSLPANTQSAGVGLRCAADGEVQP